MVTRKSVEQIAALVLLLLLWVGSAFAEGHPDFHRDVWPILRDRCVICHGPDKVKGGLRLDHREGAASGGYSGQGVLSAPAAENELVQRIEAPDPELRMPPEGDPLTPEQVQVIKDWITTGADWPPLQAADLTKQRQAPPPAPLFDRLLEIAETTRTAWFAALASAVLLAVLLVLRRLQSKAIPLATSNNPHWLDRMANVSLSVPVVGLLFAVILGMGQWIARLQDKLQRAVVRSPLVAVVSGNEATPTSYQVVPQHPPRLGGEYYRGNDERSERLFNGGYYRTATLNLHLVDELGHVLAWGDLCPAEPHIEFRFTRAAKATKELFTERITAKIRLSDVPPPEFAQVAEEQLMSLDVLEPGERWRVVYSVRDLVARGACRGNLFLYSDVHQAEGRYTGIPGFRIDYDLRLEDGKIASSSTLRLVSLEKTARLITARSPGDVTAEQWFDFRPIPEIEGNPPSDPQLLGIPQHIAPELEISSIEAAPSFTESSRNLHFSGDNDGR
jgi:hypothetical protein